VNSEWTKYELPFTFFMNKLLFTLLARFSHILKYFFSKSANRFFVSLLFLSNYGRRSGAHPDIIKREVKQLQEIENLLSKEFFKDVKKRFRRKTRRSTMDSNWKRSRSFNRHSAIFMQPNEDSPSKKRSNSSKHNFHTRSQSLIEIENSPVVDDIDGPFVESIDLYSIPTLPVRPPRPKLGMDIDLSDEVVTPKTPTQVKFSDSTNDVRSENSDTNRSAVTTASEALDFEFNIVIDIESGKCTLHSGSQEPSESALNK